MDYINENGFNTLFIKNFSLITLESESHDVLNISAYNNTKNDLINDKIYSIGLFLFLLINVMLGIINNNIKLQRRLKL